MKMTTEEKAQRKVVYAQRAKAVRAAQKRMLRHGELRDAKDMLLPAESPLRLILESIMDGDTARFCKELMKVQQELDNANL